jgi:demethylmenaquinone methyltransferase/2-methoxy-6-polyprenyl-1,4-benzoquinol methylase
VQTSTLDPHRFAQELFDPLPDRYDRLEAWLSLGQNQRWRAAMITHALADDPPAVLDVATGTAGVALDLVAQSHADVTGVDLTPAMLQRGRAEVARANADSRIQLVAGQAERLPFPDATFDALTFTYLLRYVVDPAATLRELGRVLRPGAPMASLEFAVPANPIWRGCWWCYTRGVLPVAGYLTGGAPWFRVGHFLGPNISAHYETWPVARTLTAWRDAGFVDVGAKPMSLGGGVVMWGRRA